MKLQNLLPILGYESETLNKLFMYRLQVFVKYFPGFDSTVYNIIVFYLLTPQQIYLILHQPSKLASCKVL